MANLRINYKNPNKSANTLANSLQQQGRHHECVVLSNEIHALGAGLVQGSGSSLTVQITDNSVAASGSVTLASASAADTVTVGNIVFTAVSGTPSGNQFKVGVSNTADGLSLATAINANSTLAPHVLASNASGAVTITALDVGTVGNLLQLSSSNNTRLAVVAFASGADATVKTYNF